MAEFTKDIEQIQHAASQTRFAPPSQSLGQDVVNLASTGLDFYANMKNKEQEQVQLQAQQEQQKMLNKGILGFRQLREQLKGQGLTRTQIMQRENSYLSQFGESARVGIISGTNKLTGQTTAQVVDSSEKAMLAQKENRNILEIDAVSKANLAGISIDPSNMTDEELHRYVLKGTESEAQLKARMAQWAENSAKAKNVQEKRKEDNQLFQDIGISSLVSQISVDMGNQIRSMGGLTPANAPNIVTTLQERKMNVRNTVYSEYVRNSKEMGLSVSQESIDLMIDSAESAIDAQIEIISNPDGLKAIQNNLGIAFEGGLLKMAGSSSELDRKAAFNILASNYAKTPLLIEDFDVNAKYAASMLAGKADFTDTEGLRNTVKTLSPLDPNKAVERYDYVSTVLENTLDGTPTQQKAVVKSGAYGDIVATIAEEGSVIVAPEEKRLQAERMYKTTAKVLTATIADINISNAYKKDHPSGMSMYMSDAKDYTFDKETFQLVKSFSNQQPLKEVEVINKIIRDQIKAFEELGMSEDYIKNFKEDVLVSLSISPTEK